MPQGSTNAQSKANSSEQIKSNTGSYVLSFFETNNDPDYPYSATSTAFGTEQYSNAMAIFNAEDALSGNFAPYCDMLQQSSANYVTVFAKNDPGKPVHVTITRIY